MKNILLPVVMQIIGAAVIIAEIIIPSAGVLSIIAICLFGYSIYIVFTTVSQFAGFVFVCADMVLLPVLIIYGIKLMAKSPVTLRKELSASEGYTSQSQELEGYMGLEGETVTDLRPSGTAFIGEKRLDVIARGEYIEKGRNVIVSAVEGNQVIVKLKE